MIEREFWYRTASSMESDLINLLRLFIDRSISADDLRTRASRVLQEGGAADMSPLLERGEDGRLYITRKWYELNSSKLLEIARLVSELARSNRSSNRDQRVQDAINAYSELRRLNNRSLIIVNDWLVPGRVPHSNEQFTHREEYVRRLNALGTHMEVTYFKSVEELDRYLDESIERLRQVLSLVQRATGRT